MKITLLHEGHGLVDAFMRHALHDEVNREVLAAALSPVDTDRPAELGRYFGMTITSDRQARESNWMPPLALETKVKPSSLFINLLNKALK